MSSNERSSGHRPQATRLSTEPERFVEVAHDCSYNVKYSGMAYGAPNSH